MDDKFRKMALEQIDAVLKDFDQKLIRDKSREGGWWTYIDRTTKDYPHAELSIEIITRISQVIFRVAPPNSIYKRQMEESLSNIKELDYKLSNLFGILKAMRADYEAGFLESIYQLAQAEIFGDFLEMASYLLAEGYKDAAAVIAGSVLEEHLRKLCLKHGVNITKIDNKGDIVPLSASQLNQDLYKANVYTKQGEKQVTTWLGLRNSAAHGIYGDYTVAEVKLMIQGIEDFLTRTPS